MAISGSPLTRLPEAPGTRADRERRPPVIDGLPAACVDLSRPRPPATRTVLLRPVRRVSPYAPGVRRSVFEPRLRPRIATPRAAPRSPRDPSAFLPACPRWPGRASPTGRSATRGRPPSWLRTGSRLRLPRSRSPGSLRRGRRTAGRWRLSPVRRPRRSPVRSPRWDVCTAFRVTSRACRWTAA